MTAYLSFSRHFSHMEIRRSRSARFRRMFRSDDLILQSPMKRSVPFSSPFAPFISGPAKNPASRSIEWDKVEESRL